MKKSVKIIIALVVILFVGIGVIIGLSNHNRQTEKIKIVATNFPAYDFARAVAGDTAEIKMLVAPGAETHDFEPTPGDIIDIENSDLFIYNGGESDDWIEGILGDINTDKTKLFKMMDSVDVVEEKSVKGMEEDKHDKKDHNDKDHDNEGPEYDEHIWTSPKNAIKIINNIKDELTKISPDNKEKFEKNTKEYTTKLADLDSQFQKIVDHGKRKLIVFGDRFPLRYFVDEYGLDYFAAFPGCSEQTEASSETVAFLIDKVKSEKIPVVFKIEMSSGKLAETIAGETGAKVLELNAAHNISADDFKNGRTYAEIMQNNLTALEEALK